MTKDEAQHTAIEVTQTAREAAKRIDPTIVAFGGETGWAHVLENFARFEHETITRLAQPSITPAAEVVAFAKSQADHWLPDMDTRSKDARHASLLAMALNCVKHGMALSTATPPSEQDRSTSEGEGA